ncbi:MAG: hypothetical protein KGI82_01385 [Betaproteobacteria bacterium]|nr:hypothetical protein [Betaproteobacteria bacterium]
MMRRSVIRQAARLLLATVLFQAFLVAGALAAFERADIPGSRVQVCSASGLRWVQVQSGDSAPQPASASHHCTLCGCLAADLPPALHLLAPGTATPGAPHTGRAQVAFPKPLAGQRPPTRAPPAFA